MSDRKYKVFVAQSAAARAKFHVSEALESMPTNVELVLSPLEEEMLSVEQLADALADADAMITGWGAGKAPAEAYARADRLRHVALIGSSLANVAPEAVWARGGVMSNAARAIGESVAEFTVGMILTTIHRCGAYSQALHAGASWPEAQGAGSQHDLSDQRVGLVGLGAVGREVVRRLAAFGCEIVVFDPYVSDAALAEIGVARVGRLDELFRSCRIVSLHAGMTPETAGLVSAERLAMMAPGSILINTARGGLVDEDALVAWLGDGRNSAALDVYQKEPLAPDHPLRSLPNVLLSPHLAGYCNPSTYARCSRAVVADVLRVLSGQQPENLVTPEMHSRAT